MKQTNSGFDKFLDNSSLIFKLNQFNTLQLLQAYEQAIDENIISSITDTTGVIIHVNKKFCEVSKYSVDELIGQNHRIINSGHHSKDFFKTMWQTIGRGDVWHNEIKNKAKDGEYYWVDTVIVPIKNGNGKVTHYLSLRTLITDRKKSEDTVKKYVKELEELNTHKETVLAVLSHDLRSPLSGIIGAAKHLQSNFDTLKTADIKEMLGLLYKASTDELNMLDYLVEWARIKYASEAFSPTIIQLSQCVDEVFNSFNEVAIENAIHLHNEIEENTSVFADRKMLLSIIRNIVSNALKHTPAGGKITVSAKKNEDEIIVEIKDTGIGMSEKIREKLFIPQMTSLANARKDNKGAGIGLLLIKGFVEKNGGKIWVESEVDLGSTFYFTLPADKPMGGQNFIVQKNSQRIKELIS